MLSDVALRYAASPLGSVLELHAGHAASHFCEEAGRLPGENMLH